MFGRQGLEMALFGLGVFPAVSIQKSVSRVGAKALDPFWRKVSFEGLVLLLPNLVMRAQNACTALRNRLQ